MHLSKFKSLLFSLLMFSSTLSFAQVDGDQTGAWYMYFWSTTIKDGPWGFQGDIQHRNWDVIGDLEQLLLRGGITYQPTGSNVKFTFGYGNITTGEFGDGDNTVNESRIYQEALIPQKLGSRVFLTHRFRFEQRWVENQDTRTRFRYNIFMNIALNQTSLSKGAIYLAFYNELFINGQRSIGDARTVELFDRNRFYSAIGHSLSDNLRIQFGLMTQTTDNWQKKQLQFSLHHNF